MEIKNRVANSGLITIDLEELYRREKAEWADFDLKNFLLEDVLLKEKNFREELKGFCWNDFRGKFVHLYCSADAILPGWAFLLPLTYLQPVAKKVVFTHKENLDPLNEVLKFLIENLDPQIFKNERVIIKGCNKLKIQQERYLDLVQKIQPYVKSLMYGEACSTVPLYKRKN